MVSGARKLMLLVLLLTGLGASACSSSLSFSELSPGDCVAETREYGLTIEGGVKKADCSEPATDTKLVWMLETSGTETEVRESCPFYGFKIADQGTAYCFIRADAASIG